MLDLDADPVAVDAALSDDPALAPLVARRPGLRIPGAADGWEAAVRAVVGPGRVGRRRADGAGPDGRGARRARWRPRTTARRGAFPAPEALAEAPDDALPMPAARRAALRALAAAVASGDLSLEPGDDPAPRPGGPAGAAGRGAVDRRLRGAADASATRTRSCRPTWGRGARAARLGLPDDPAGLAARAERWRPWRGYALLHLWTSGTTTMTTKEGDR